MKTPRIHENVWILQKTIQALDIIVSVARKPNKNTILAHPRRGKQAFWRILSADWSIPFSVPYDPRCFRGRRENPPAIVEREGGGRVRPPALKKERRGQGKAPAAANPSECRPGRGELGLNYALLPLLKQSVFPADEPFAFVDSGLQAALGAGFMIRNEENRPLCGAVHLLQPLSDG